MPTVQCAVCFPQVFDDFGVYLKRVRFWRLVARVACVQNGQFLGGGIEALQSVSDMVDALRPEMERWTQWEPATWPRALLTSTATEPPSIWAVPLPLHPLDI